MSTDPVTTEEVCQTCGELRTDEGRSTCSAPHGPDTVFLTLKQQETLRRALMRSVRIISND